MGFLGPLNQGKDESRLFKTTDLIWRKLRSLASVSASSEGRFVYHVVKKEGPFALALPLALRSSISRGHSPWALPFPSCSRSLEP